MGIFPSYFEIAETLTFFPKFWHFASSFDILRQILTFYDAILIFDIISSAYTIENGNDFESFQVCLLDNNTCFQSKCALEKNGLKIVTIDNHSNYFLNGFAES